MRTPSKFVAPLTDEQRLRLQSIYKSDPLWRTRQRAQAVLLSARGYTVNQLAELFEIDRDRIAQWLDWWNEFLFDGLADEPRSGRPAIFDSDEKKRSSDALAGKSALAQSREPSPL